MVAVELVVVEFVASVHMSIPLNVVDLQHHRLGNYYVISQRDWVVLD